MNPKVHSFIVRVWAETEDGHQAETGELRGSIDHVGTGRRLYFRELDSILCFISEQVSGTTIGGRSRGLLASLKRLMSRAARKGHES